MARTVARYTPRRIWHWRKSKVSHGSPAGTVAKLQKLATVFLDKPWLSYSQDLFFFKVRDGSPLEPWLRFFYLFFFYK